MGRTTELRKALKSTFFPHVMARGFVVDTRHQPMFTIFRRTVDGAVQVFDIQWEKYGSPRFVLNFGAVPLDGTDLAGAPINPAEVQPHDCKPCLRLQRRRGGSLACWFQLRKLLWEQLTTLRRDHAPAEVVGSLLAAYPEMEDWWQSRKRGPHVNGMQPAGVAET